MTGNVDSEVAAAGADAVRAGKSGNDRRAEESSQGQNQGPGNSKVPTVSECLASLSQISGMVALKLITPAQANAMRGSLEAILRQHNRSGTRVGATEGNIQNMDLVDLAKRDPQVLNMLETILTDQQIAMVVKATKDGGCGKT